MKLILLPVVSKGQKNQDQRERRSGLGHLGRTYLLGDLHGCSVASNRGGGGEPAVLLQLKGMWVPSMVQGAIRVWGSAVSFVFAVVVWA